MLNGRISAAANRLVVIFTVIEAVVFTLWLDALGLTPGINVLPNNDLLAFVILAAGLFVEHRIAAVSNKV